MLKKSTARIISDDADREPRIHKRVIDGRRCAFAPENEEQTMQRSCFKNTLPVSERLANQVDRLRSEAGKLPPGPQRDFMERKARQTEAAANVPLRLTSPGLQPPK
jgi:hypothetical protein